RFRNSVIAKIFRNPRTVRILLMSPRNNAANAPFKIFDRNDGQDFAVRLAVLGAHVKCSRRRIVGKTRQLRSLGVAEASQEQHGDEENPSPNPGERQHRESKIYVAPPMIKPGQEASAQAGSLEKAIDPGDGDVVCDGNIAVVKLGSGTDRSLL